MIESDRSYEDVDSYAVMLTSQKENPHFRWGFSAQKRKV